jgi:hypothetical protein
VSGIERPKLDLDRVGKLLGVAGTTAHDGEAVNAIRPVDRLLREAGLRWPDLTDGYHQGEIATKAGTVLHAELTEAHAQLAAIDNRRRDWRRVQYAQVRSSHQVTAEWCLDQYGEDEVHLNSFERDFLTTVANWYGALTRRQRPVFIKNIHSVIRRSGRQPP